MKSFLKKLFHNERGNTLIAALAADPGAVTLSDPGDGPAMLLWRGHPLARVERGRTLLSPRLRLEAAGYAAGHPD